MNGRTIHSRFAVPIPIFEHSTSLVKKSQKQLIHKTDVIIWDEAPMQQKEIMENVDRTLRDIMQNNIPFGGKMIVFCGDFRQVAPVIPRASRSYVISKSLPRSKLWCHIDVLQLTVNERINRMKNISKSERIQLNKWADLLLKIGEDRYDKTDNDLIRMGKSYISDRTNANEFIADIYGKLHTFNIDDPITMDRLLNTAILTPKNEHMREINKIAISQFPGQIRRYKSIDHVKDEAYISTYSTELLNSLDINNFPSHILHLKCGAPVMVLRNIDPLNGICNGTQGIITNMAAHVIEIETVDVNNTRKRVFIPRMSLLSNDSKIPIKFYRKQFPVTLSFAITINKSQGQTLKKVGVYLKEPVFSHGQLYVALSRVTHPKNLKIYVEETQEHGMRDVDGNAYIKNIVYTELLVDAGVIDGRDIHTQERYESSIYSDDESSDSFYHDSSCSESI